MTHADIWPSCCVLPSSTSLNVLSLSLSYFSVMGVLLCSPAGATCSRPRTRRPVDQVVFRPGLDHRLPSKGLARLHVGVARSVHPRSAFGSYVPGDDSTTPSVASTTRQNSSRAALISGVIGVSFGSVFAQSAQGHALFPAICLLVAARQAVDAFESFPHRRFLRWEAGATLRLSLGCRRRESGALSLPTAPCRPRTSWRCGRRSFRCTT